MSAAMETQRRRAVKAELLEGAERAQGSSWGDAVKRDLNRHTDAYLLYDAYFDLKTVYLQRWSPEARALISQARAAVKVAMNATSREFAMIARRPSPRLVLLFACVGLLAGWLALAWLINEMLDAGVGVLRP